MEERRKNKRMELQSTLSVKRLDGSEMKDVDIEIIDVSKTGVGFSCNVALEIGAVYESNLRIWTQEVLHAFLEIVRIEKQGNTYIYGAIFIGMPEMDASRIETYETVNDQLANS
ncbi:MAG: PilZ domain-containing protein [Lachnospiraceae bacterium]|nr:PilZ domain-containing protein [Lachnospiraceae bacterium]